MKLNSEIVKALLSGETVLLNDEQYTSLTAFIDNVKDQETYTKLCKLVSIVNKDYSLGIQNVYNVYLK